MIYRELLQLGTEILTKAGIEEAPVDAWYLFEYVTGLSRSAYIMQGDEEVLEDEKEEYRIIILKRAERIPLQYIIGEQSFMGMNFKVNSNVLIPRMDTEVLVVETAKKLKEGMKVLDMCTGSGCIIISLMHLVEGIEGVGSDISKQAVIVAKENAVSNQIGANFICSDMFAQIEDSYDIIVSNPPYIPTAVINTLMPEVRDFEPVGALDGHEDGLYFYRILAKEAPGHINAGGYLFLEIGCEQAEDVKKLLEEEEFKDVTVIRDLAGLDRVVYGRKE
ncbi:MAG: peptide chain release factor N(5)-glutamine methyltransferase [Eubacterium sp.]|nr:peptide chain release factor N(5)-glutamine methyltransferase [Eubacterium sp.]